MTYIKKSSTGKRHILTIIGLLSAALVLVIASALFYSDGSKSKEAGTVNIVSKELDKQNVVRAVRSIKAGELADAVKFELVAVPKELVPVEAVLSMQQLKDKRIATDLTEKEFLLISDLVDSEAWYEDGDRLIEHSFSEGTIPNTVTVGSVVDIKLFRPEREDNIVVAKTTVIDKRGNIIGFYLNEEEQEYLKEANIEGLLFLVQYLDKSQNSSKVNYIPSYNAASQEPAANIKKK